MPCGVWKVGHPARRSAQRPSGTASRRSDSRDGWIGRGPQIQQLEKYGFCSHILRMTEATPRRTEALKLRQTISQLLDQIFAIEQSMEIFHRKDDAAQAIATAKSLPEIAKLQSEFIQKLAVTYEPTKSEPERYIEPKTRLCLVCKTPFQSEWSGERICRRCKSAKIWRSGGVATQ
jgi:hypothetical protein